MGEIQVKLQWEEIKYVIDMKPGQKYGHFYEDENRSIEIKKTSHDRYRFRFCGNGRTICAENNITADMLVTKWSVFIHGFPGALGEM